MADFKLKLPTLQNTVWIPAEIADSIGRNLRLTSGYKVAVLYGENAKPEEVVDALTLIVKEIELRATKRRLGGA